MEIQIAHLYPKLMNTYGDSGNIICIQKRCEWRNIKVTIHQVNIGDEIPPNIDLYFFGGGQDRSQKAVGIDLQTKKERLTEDISNGVPLLAICGGYQLCGKEYIPIEGDPIPGISLFPVTTKGSKKRMIGNVVLNLNETIFGSITPKTIVGFENHSGQTFLDKNATQFGTVIKGYGNNGSDHLEGCIVNNAIGCYLHGSVLPKNPHLADYLIQKAIQIKNPEYLLPSIQDDVEWQTHNQLIKTILGK